MKQLLSICLFIFSVAGFSQTSSTMSTDVVPEGMEDTGGSIALVSEEEVPSGMTGVYVKASCYGQNNRSTTNPLSPNATVVIEIDAGGVNNEVTFKGTFPPKNSQATATVLDILSASYSNSCGDFCTGTNLSICNRNCTDFNSCSSENMQNPVFVDLGGLQSTGEDFFGQSWNTTVKGELNRIYDTIFYSKGTVGDKCATTSFRMAFDALAEESCSDKSGNQFKNCKREASCIFACGLNDDVASCTNICVTAITNNQNLSMDAPGGGNGDCKINNSTSGVGCQGGIVTGVINAPNSIKNFTQASTTSELNRRRQQALRQIQITHKQKGLDCDGVKPFIGCNGVMQSAKTTKTLLGNMGESPLLKITAAYPGQDGYCGGYHSPLMIFFDYKHPLFTAKSDFLRRDTDGTETFWVEKNHHGYFLARFEKDHSKGIYHAKQLFGENAENFNGFDALQVYDDNGDFVIDKNDKIFKDLTLWKDANSNGRSDQGELVSLAKAGIFKISLNYEKSFRIGIADRAKAQGRAKVFYRKEGEKSPLVANLYDIYFADAH